MKYSALLPLAALAFFSACRDVTEQQIPTEPGISAPAGPSLSSGSDGSAGNTVCDTYTEKLASLRAESAPNADEVATYEALVADACDN